MSHTISVKVEMKNKQAIAMAASIVGAKVKQGTHRLFGDTHEGLGVSLKGWQYPVIFKDDGTIAYDNYNGMWGDIKELEDLKSWYTLCLAQSECQNLGWMTTFDQVKGELIVHHPSGGNITVTRDGVLDAVGFSGTACEDATSKLEHVLGSRLNETIKPEMNEVILDQKESA